MTILFYCTITLREDWLILFLSVTLGGSTKISAVWLIYWEISNHGYFRPFSEILKGFGLSFVSVYGVGQDDQQWTYPELHPGVWCHKGHFQCYWVQLWFMVSAVSDSTFSSKFSTPTWTFSSISMVKVRCLHRLESVIYHYVSVPAPPVPPEVPTRNPVVLCQCATWHKNYM